MDKVVQLNVFNRWGETVFSANNYQPGDKIVQWNGNSKTGKKLNPGVFIYQAQLSFNDGTSKNIYGEVTLLR